MQKASVAGERAAVNRRSWDGDQLFSVEASIIVQNTLYLVPGA